MSRRVVSMLEDDIDGSPADETVTFALDGVTYEIDLSKDNAARLREALAEWIARARRTGGRRSTGRQPAAGGRQPGANEVRAWAQAQGYEVSSRGRVPREVREAYDKAHA